MQFYCSLVVRTALAKKIGQINKTQFWPKDRSHIKYKRAYSLHRLCTLSQKHVEKAAIRSVRFGHYTVRSSIQRFFETQCVSWGHKIIRYNAVQWLWTRRMCIRDQTMQKFACCIAALNVTLQFRYCRLRHRVTLVLLPRCTECRRGLAMRKLFVRLSVRLSVKRVSCDKTEERSVQIFIQYERSFSLVFREEKRLVGGDPFYLKFWVN